MINAITNSIRHYTLGPISLLLNYAIQVTNSAHHKVWRSGTQYSLSITPPSGYIVPTWQIINHKTRSVVESGSGNTVTRTLTYASIANCNTYDVRIVISKGATTFERILASEITVKPPTFTEGQADVVWDLSVATGNKDGTWTDRSTDPNGYKIYVKGTGTGRLNPFYWYSSDPTKPIHVIFDNAKLNTTTFGLTPGPCQNIEWDGVAFGDQSYGLVVTKTVGNDQGFQHTHADAIHESFNNVFSGIEVNGAGLTGNGSAGIQITPVDLAAFNASNYTYTGLVMHDCYSHDVYGEGFYFGHFTDFDDDADTRFYNLTDDSLFYRLVSRNTGNEGIQFGGASDSELYLCQIFNAGTRNDASHRNGIQWSDGNRNCFCYQNYIETTKNLFSGFAGRNGTDNEFFSNIWYTTGKVAAGVNMFIRMDANINPVLTWKFFNNTIIIADGLPWSLYNGSGTITSVFNPLVLADNIIVTNTATQTEVVNGFNATNVTLNNYQVTTIASVGFVDVASKNYKLASTSSPAFRARTSFTKVHPLANYDFQGVKFDTSVVGAYSGYEQMTNGAFSYKNITSITTPAPITDILWQTVFDDLDLPSYVNATLSNGNTRNILVSWGEGSYNGNLPNTYVLTGTLILPDDVTNTSSVGVTINVTVVSPTVYNITSVVDPTDLGTVTNGTTYASLIKPATGTTNLSNGSTRVVDISWAQGTYNAAVAATYTLFGTPTNLPLDVANPSNIQFTMDVTVAAGVSEFSYNVDFQVQAGNTSAGWFSTNTVAPFPGDPINVGNITNTSGATSGVGLRYINPGSGTRWNAGGAAGQTTGNNSGVVPDAVLLDYIYCDAGNTGKLEFYNLVGTPLNGRILNMRIVGSRGGTTGVLCEYRVNGGTWQTLNVSNNTANSVYFTGVQAVAGIITVEARVAAGSSSTFAFLNGIKVSTLNI